MLLVQEMTVSNEYKYDWEDQFWAANVLLALTTDGGTFHGQTISFLQFWICGTDEVQTDPAFADQLYLCSHGLLSVRCKLYNVFLCTANCQFASMLCICNACIATQKLSTLCFVSVLV